MATMIMNPMMAPNFGGMQAPGFVSSPDSLSRRGAPAPMQSAMQNQMNLFSLTLEAMMLVLLNLMKGQISSPAAAAAPPSAQADAAPSTSAPSNSGGSSSHAVGGSSSSSAPSAVSGALPAGSSLGDRIAHRAEANARAVNTKGYCLRETGKVLREFGIPCERHPAAYQALSDLQHSNKVREIHVSKDQLDKLPPGAITVWDKAPGLPYGHICVALGHGREASSAVCNTLKLNSGFHVFVPVG